MKEPIKIMNLAMSPKGDVTQWFAENPKLYSQFGLDGHNGVDLVRPHGEPLYAIESGTIIAVENNPHGYGKHLRILSDYKDSNGRQREWAYGHNSVNLVVVGQKVIEGDKIALMGNTGFTISGATPYWKVNPYAGTHLHIGVRLMKQTVKGWSYEGSDIKLSAQNYQNGYKGCIDPRPFLEALIKDVPEENKVMYKQLLSIQSIINTLRSLLLGK
jgi:murein DD-endopeptidase MepM/ murein hydrolase activator NlpD